MKKKLIIIIISLFLTLSLNYYEYLKFREVTNTFVSSLIDEVKLNYPQVNGKDLVELINTSKKSNTTLKKYGFLENDLSYLKEIDKTFYQNIILSSLVILTFTSLIIIYIDKDRKRKNREINELISYLKKINEGIYNLELLNNEEGDLSILKNEIYKTTVSLKTSLEKEAQDKLKLKDNLANIAHQIKTPLTSITLMIDMILEENLTKEKEREFLKDMRREIDNTNFLIMAMLKLSRFDAGVIEFIRKDVLVSDLISNSLQKLDLLRELKGIKVHVKGEEKLKIKVDAHWEEEALTNIIKNAYEHSNELGNVDIFFEDRGTYVSIEIINEGLKISDKDMKHLFERFYKGSEKGNNFGIGLSLAKEIIEHDGGIIKVKSDKDKTKFIIRYYKDKN